MLVPGHTTSRTRSIRISHATFYSLFCISVVICATILILYFQSRLNAQAAESAFISLEQSQTAYVNLQRISEQEQINLFTDVISLQFDIEDEYNRHQEDLQQQQQNFIDNLTTIRVHAEDLEIRLRQYELYRQEIVKQLSESAHLPVVSNILEDIYYSEILMLSEFEELFTPETIVNDQTQLIQFTFYPSDVQSPDFCEDMQNICEELMLDELFYYIQTLELALEAQKELYSQLQEHVGTAAPIIRRDKYGPRLLYWSYVRNVLPRNTPVMVTDVRTGITYWISSFSHGNHADVVPVSPEDTAALLRTFGGSWSWNTRPIWVHIGDRKVAASINGMPHGVGGGRNNNMNGHICIHFRGSRTHSGSAFHERDHQNSVMQAYRADF